MAACWAGCCLPKRPGAARAAAAGGGGGEAGRPAARAEPGGSAPVGEVEVVEVKREWCEMEDPEGDAGEEHFERVAAAAHQARERRLTAGQEALERAEDQGTPLGDADVEIVTQGHEWCQLAVDSDDEDAKPDGEERRLSLASESFKSRERRLTAGAEVLSLAMRQGAPVGGDYDVEVVQQAGEWGELPEDSDDDDEAEDAALARRAADAHSARERRLTAGAGAISAASRRPEAPAPATKDVAVVAQSKEWEGLEQDRLCRHAADAHQARERRLTVGAEALTLAPLECNHVGGEQDVAVVSQSQDVAVVSQSQEWRELEQDSDEEEETRKAQLDRRAADAHLARERRLTAGAEALTLGSLLPDHVANGHDVEASKSIAVVAQSKEWGDLEEDSDEEVAASQHLSRRATDVHAAREKRLSVGAEALALGLQQATAPAKSSRGADVVAQSTEWGEVGDDSDEEATKDQLLRHATEAHVAREKRLTAGAEAIAFAMQQPVIPSVASKGVAVVAQSKEWDELEEDSDDDTAAVEEKLSHHAANAHLARERRLTAGAESIAIAMQQPVTSAASSKDVALVAQTTEWGELEEDSDEDAADKEELSRHATDAHTAREKRLTAGAAAIAFAMQQQPAIVATAAKDVEVVAQSAEWGELADDSDQEDAAPEQLSRHAAGAHLAREKRLSVGAEAIGLAVPQPAVPATSSGDVAVVAQSKEWGELGEDSDEDTAPQEQRSRHASRAHTARERRLTAGAESIAIAMRQPVAPAVPSKDVDVVAQATEWGELEEDSDEDAAGLERHATDAHIAREKRLTLGAESLALASHLPGHVSNQDVEVIAQSKEWVEIEGDSEEENAAAEERLCRHASDALKARERRLTAGAEALQLALGSGTVA